MFKNIWFQIHWFIGITAGTLLMAIGVTGAVLSFREDIMDVMNPGVMHVAVRAQQPLSPPQLLDKLRDAEPGQRVLFISVSAEPGASARVMFAPPGERRGETRFADPYTGELLPKVAGQPFFEVVERFHRFLLLPRELGKVIVGTLVLLLLTLALSGLYLRWPRRPWSLRAWFRLDFKRSGRSFLWNLHSVIGTWCLAMYVISAMTGAYWALDWVRNGMDALAGQGRPVAVAKPAARAPGTPRGGERPPQADMPLDLSLTWNAFLAKAPLYQNAQFRLPEKSSQPVQIFFVADNAPHDRARSRMNVLPQTGEVKLFDLYDDRSTGGKALTTIYPLHMGTYFGLPGRIIMTLTSLLMPLFGITGWMLYLDRRRKKAALRAERDAFAHGHTGQAAGAGGSPYLVAHASQTGQAERVALHTAALLRGQDAEVTVQSLARITPETLRHHPRILFVVSTFGEGDAPDSARAFARRLHDTAGQSLSHVHYALLALGDRNYEKFCGFGHALDHWLRNNGAVPLFAPVEVDRMAPAALRHWERSLAAHGMLDAARLSEQAPLPATDPVHGQWQDWTLAGRRQLNPGSQGEGIYHLALQSGDHAATWQPGALVEVLPRHAPDRICLLLQRLQLDGDTPVQAHGMRCTLRDALSCSVLPLPHGADMAQDPATAAQTLADGLLALPPRSYSVASVPHDGALHLLVRQSRHEDGLGLASGWLTAYAAAGSSVSARLVDNASFGPADAAQPAIFIGNGSGLAGLRGHLRARVAQAGTRNWLLFGERNRAHDFLYRDELEAWLADGRLARLDLAFSRDQGKRIYVQDRLLQAAEEVRRWVADGAVIFVCGSLQGMAAGVDAALVSILGQGTVDDLIAQGRYRRDVY